MDFPNTAAEGSDAEKAGIGSHVDVVNFDERQTCSKAAPVCSTVGGAVDSKESSGKDSVLIDRTDYEPGNRNVRQARAGVRERQPAIGRLGDSRTRDRTLRSDIEGGVVCPLGVCVESLPAGHCADETGLRPRGAAVVSHHDETSVADHSNMILPISGGAYADAVGRITEDARGANSR